MLPEPVPDNSRERERERERGVVLTRQAREAVASLLPGRKRKFRKQRLGVESCGLGEGGLAGLWQDYY